MRISRLLLLLAIAIGALFVFELGSLVVLLRQADKTAPVLPSQVRNWTTLARKDRVPPRFIWTGTLKRPLSAGSRSRVRLDGETGVLLVLADASGASIHWKTGVQQGQERVLAQAQWRMPLKTGDELHIAKSPGWINVFRGNTRFLAVSCPAERFSAGVWQVSTPAGPERGPAPDLMEARFQKTTPPYFADDFMHGEGALGEWQAVSGKWTVSALDNPIRSANAFSFWGRGESALATVGYWFWRNYQVVCSVHPLDPVRFGVLLCHTANGQAYRLDWEAPTGDGPGSLRLVRIGGGGDKVLAETRQGFVRAQWYRLRVRQFEGALRVWIDDVPVLQARDPTPLLGGLFGLWTQGGDGVVFDDVELTPAAAFRVDFPCTPGDWPMFLRPTDEGGHSGVKGGLDLAALGGTLDAALPLLDNASVRIACTGLETVSGSLALEVRRRQGDRGVYVRLSPKSAGNVKVEIGENGVPDPVHKSLTVPSLPSSAEVSLHTAGSTAWACIGDRAVAVVSGLHVMGAGTSRVALSGTAPGLHIQSLAVAPEQPAAEIENWVETFAHEESMQAWGDPESEWIPRREERNGMAFWHRSDFWSDFSARLDLGSADTNRGDWGFVLAGDDPEAAVARCRFTVARSNGTPVLCLDTTGEPSREKKLKQDPTRITIARRQGRLLARIDGAVMWEEPLPGFLGGLVRIGRVGGNPGRAWARAVHIGAPGVRTWSFKQAPADWVPATGVWEVTNRWQCDPRWSFFAGVKRGGPACIWNKRLHGENVTLEFFTGPKMDMERGRHYEYAADLNAVLCADGKNIDSGYSFMLGGWNDSGSFLVRGRDVLERTSWAVIPRVSATHHRWFYVKIRKAGNRITAWLDGRKVADKEDPAPLEGRHFGLWTWDNGMMVAQVRVSTDSALVPATVLEAPPGVPRTPYSR